MLDELLLTEVLQHRIVRTTQRGISGHGTVCHYCFYPFSEIPDLARWPALVRLKRGKDAITANLAVVPLPWEGVFGRIALQLPLLKKVLVNFLDLKGVFYPAPDVVTDHECG